MINNENAERFVDSWLQAFNSGHLETILDHYTNDIVFYSPFVLQLGFNDKGVIKGKGDLRRYFEAALQRYPDLRFQPLQHFTGINTVVIHYLSVGGRLAAEVFQLNEAGKAATVFCNYATGTTSS